MKTPLGKLLVLLTLWALAAAVAGSFGLLGRLPPGASPIIIAGLTLSFSIALSRVGWLREAVILLGVRRILAVHLFRMVGVYFFWLEAAGKLPGEFAQRAGWGDIAAAGGAFILLFWREGPGFRRALFAWNILGAVDLLVAVGTAGWLNFTRPGSMVEIGQLPLALIPLWAVPVLLSSHLLLFRQQLSPVRSADKTAVHA